MDKDTLEQTRLGLRRFVREKLVPLEKQVADEDRIPDEIRRGFAEMGLYGLSIPEEYGGLGLTMAEEVELVFELGWTSPAFRSLFGTNVGIGSQGILMDGTAEQKETWLPRLASGEVTASFALTEPEAGSDAASVKTRAERQGDHYVVNGTKRFITNAPHAGIFTLMARTDPNNKGAGGVTAFIVEAKTPGITIGRPDKKMGQRGSHTADVIFENAKVPAANIIGGREGQGFKTAMKVLDRGRLHISAMCVGAAERLIHESVSYARDRKQFGQAIAEFQLIQAMLADSRTEAYAARCMVRDAAGRYAAGEAVSMEASSCKYFASEMVGRVADRAVQIHGGSGYIQEYAVERFYRDVRLFRLYEGTSQIQQLVIAKQMLRQAESGQDA
ncbi:acyl-CoA dehydrogenase family protein [Ferrovibrio terrae]|uniref:acyl-CoA dehydrogenase family protein n=1 Tax=Ferrovibrio terrae TaxID=2594003 RepID=UPI0031378265